jgi:hypothetical protein
VKTRVLFLTLMTALVLVALAGCSNHEGNEWERLVCEVESVNAGSPLMSAYADAGADKIGNTEDDIHTVDWVPVVFRARPYSSSVYLPEDGTQSWFHVTSYDLTWTPMSSEADSLVYHNIVGGLCDVVVPNGEDAVVSVMIADRTLKDSGWFYRTLVTDGTSFTANCALTFYGHETGNSREVAVPAGMVVTFVGFVVDN